MFFSAALFCTVILFQIANTKNLLEFGICQKGKNGQPNHICRRLNDCPTAKEELKQNRMPSICQYVGNLQIVCCKPNNTITRRTTPPSTTTSITTSRTNLRIKNAFSIVNEACERYKEEQFSIRLVPPVLIKRPPTEEKYLRCPPSETLIRGGEKAEAKEFPHMALLGYGENLSGVHWRCGGTLISEQFVLTAAHCISRMERPKWVRLGELNYAITTDDAEPEDFTISEYIAHPNYNPSYYYDDIALLRLDRPVNFSVYIRPTCLYTSPTITEKKGIATGWGVIETGEFESEELLKVSLSFMEPRICNETHANDPKLFRGIDANQMICVGEVVQGKDTCAGDSGGPIQLKLAAEPCMHTQVGITSFGDAFCGQANRPAVYTRIYNYIPWIQSIVWPTTK